MRFSPKEDFCFLKCQKVRIGQQRMHRFAVEGLRGTLHRWQSGWVQHSTTWPWVPPPLPRGCGLPCSCMHTHLVRIYLQPLSSSRQLPSSPAGGHGAPSSRARGPSKKSAASALPFSPGVRGHGRRREEPVPATRELTSLGTISSAGPRAAETGRGLGMT